MVRDHFHFSVIGKSNRVLVPCYIHVEKEDFQWGKANSRVIKEDLIRLLLEEVQTIELAYYNNPEDASATDDKPHQALNLVSSYRHAPPPTRLHGSDHCIIAYSTSSRKKYSLLTVQHTPSNSASNSTSVSTSVGDGDLTYNTETLSDFIIQCWVYPMDKESRCPNNILPIFA
jgi:hypothetical protein